MIVLNTVITLMLTLLSVLFIKTVMQWLNTPEDVFHQASRKIFEFMMMPLATLANADATFVSQNYGARKYGRIREALKKVLVLETCWCIYQYLYVSVIFFFPLAVLFVLRTAFQSIGHKTAPVFSSGIELSVKILMSLLVIPKTGYWMVTATEPITWVLCAVFCQWFIVQNQAGTLLRLKI